MSRSARWGRRGSRWPFAVPPITAAIGTAAVVAVAWVTASGYGCKGSSPTVRTGLVATLTIALLVSIVVGIVARQLGASRWFATALGAGQLLVTVCAGFATFLAAGVSLLGRCPLEF